jgi:hypothetical protein
MKRINVISGEMCPICGGRTECFCYPENENIIYFYCKCGWYSGGIILGGRKNGK